MKKDTGRFAFLRQLKLDDVSCIFGNPGTSEENLFDALADPEFASIKYYLALQEGVAVAMGDSYARTTQKPALVQLHSYAGLANGLGMMYYARRGYTPMVVFAGEAGLAYDAMDGQMAADLVSMARPFVKSDHNGPCAWRVTHASSVVRMLRRALKAAATPPWGPVFLSLPMDVLEQPNSELLTPSFGVDSRVLPDAATVERAARILAAGSAPLILMGDGIAASGAQAELMRVAEVLGAPVYGVNQSEVNMPMSHPLYRGETGHMFGTSSLPVTSAADVVLVSGTTLMPEVFPHTGEIFAPGAKVVHFDLNTAEIGKNFPTTIAALADPKRALAALAAALAPLLSEDQKETAATVIREASIKRGEARAAAQAKDAEKFGQVPLRGPPFMKALAENLANLGRPFSVFDEALTHSPEITRYFSFDEPGSYFQTRAGMLGTGLPGALGLKVAQPDRIVLGFAGDGGSMQTIQALASAARHELGVKFVVCNNRSYRILKYNIERYWKDLGIAEAEYPPYPESFDLHSTPLDFVKLAEGHGVPAMRVESPEQIQPAIDRALADDKPFLIELILSSELR